MSRLSFDAIARSALSYARQIAERAAPGGVVRGREYQARNPKRADRHIGSFSINLATGQWADFATGDKGGDLVSLWAWRFDLSQAEAAKSLAALTGTGAHHD